MTPALEYYSACEGHWSAPLELRVSDSRVLRREVGWIDTLTWLLAASLPGLRLTTSVAVLSSHDVRHTTRVHWGSLTLVRSEERLALNGAAARLVGRSRTLLGRRDPIEGRVALSADALDARYQLRWLGVPLVQRSERTNEGVVLEQRGPGFASRARLRRA